MNMLARLHVVRDALASAHPLLPYLAIAGLVGGIVWAWRRWQPASFERLPASIQGLPAVLLSAVLSASSAGDTASIGRVMVELALGALAGLLPIGGHHLLKSAPGPYLGGRFPAAGLDMRGEVNALVRSKKRPPPPPVVGVLLVILSWVCPVLPGCGGASTKPGCEDAALARINAAEQAELALYCGGQGVDCPFREKIHADFKQRREDWFTRCDPGAP